MDDLYWTVRGLQAEEVTSAASVEKRQQWWKQLAECGRSCILIFLYNACVWTWGGFALNLRSLIGLSWDGDVRQAASGSHVDPYDCSCGWCWCKCLHAFVRGTEDCEKRSTKPRHHTDGSSWRSFTIQNLLCKGLNIFCILGKSSPRRIFTLLNPDHVWTQNHCIERCSGLF